MGFSDAVELLEQERTRDQRETERARIAGYSKDPGPIRRADEEPVLWGIRDRMPAIPAAIPELHIEPTLPVWITSTFDPEFQRRNAYWEVFAATVKEAEARHSRMRPVLDAYRTAQDDPNLHFLWSRGTLDGTVADVPSVVEQQRVPNEGGKPVGTIYSNDRLLLDETDREGLDAIEDAVKAGEGEVQEKGMATEGADAGVVRARRHLTAAKKEVISAAERLEGQRKRVEAALVQQKLDGQEAEVAKVQSRLGIAKSVISALKNFAATAFHLAKRDAGDAIDSFGSGVADVVDVVGQVKLGSLNERVDELKLERSKMLDEATTDDFNSALHAAASAADEAEAALVDVRIALGNQRISHNDFSKHAVAQIPSQPLSSKQRIAATLSAIPLVGEVHARATELAETSAKLPINATAMRGLGIAVAHNHPVAQPFRHATDELRTVETKARTDQRTWKKRLDQLFVVRRQILEPDRE